MAAVPVLDITVDYSDSKDSILSILKSIKPDWDLSSVEMKDLSIGYINKNVGCSINGEHGGVFVRMINEIHSQMLQNYKKISKFLSDHDLAPKLLCTFTNGICTELVEGESLRWEDNSKLMDMNTSKAVVKELARFHAKSVLEDAEKEGIVDLNEDSEAKTKERAERTRYLWNRMFADPAVPDDIKAELPDAENILETSDKLKKLIADLQPDRRLIHMDLNPSNILIKPNGSAVLVDYDLTGIGYACMDLAGFFHGFINIRAPKIEDYPNREFRLELIRFYLSEREKLDNGGVVSEEMVDQLEEQLDKSRLYWLFRYIFIGPFLTSVTQPGDEKSQNMYETSLLFYREFRKAKEECGFE